MLNNLKYFAKAWTFSANLGKFNLPMLCYCKSSKPSSTLGIIDVNIDEMMNEDDELYSNYNYDPQSQAITTINVDGGVTAPLDVNPSIDEELEKDGTIDMEYIEKEREEIHYPEPPKESSACSELQGIKITLPKKMLTPGTYSYRLNEEEQQTLPDDIRVCKFEKFKPSS